MQYHPHTPYMTFKVKVTDLNFYVKVLGPRLFLNSVVYLFHFWHDDRCWSKILCSMITNPVYDFKVTDLEFLHCNFLQFQFFHKAFNGFYSFMV